MKTYKFNGASRSEVAQMHNEDNEEIYAVALTYLVESMGFTEFTKLSAEDIKVCKEANNITKEILKKYS